MTKRYVIAIFILFGLKERNFLIALVTLETIYILMKLLIRPYRHIVFWLKLIGDLCYYLALLLLIHFKMSVDFGVCRDVNEDNLYSTTMVILIWLFIIFYIISVLISFCLLKKPA